MSCEGRTRTFLEALASTLYKDSEGNVHINAELIRTDCTDLELALACDSGLINSETQLESAFGTDDCGNPILKIGVPREEIEGVPITLTDTVWEDLRAPANGINPIGAPSPATPNTTDGSLTFGKGNVCIAWFQLPHQWKQGTDIHIHIHWSKATSAAGTVHWQMKYKWANIGDVMPGFSVLADGVELEPNLDTADLHALLEWPDADGTGKTISSMLGVFIQRTNDGGDTYAGNCNLYEIDVHYEIDSLGSDEEYIK